MVVGREFQRPIQTLTINKAVAVSAGAAQSMALLADGTVWGWGRNLSGELGTGAQFSTHFPFPVLGFTNVVAIAGGAGFNLALKADGTVWGLGANGAGQLGDGTTIDRSTAVQVSGLTNVVAIATGPNSGHSLAIKSDGTLWAWGFNFFGQIGDGTTTNRLTPVQIGGLSAMKAIATGTGHSVALKADGTVWAWGQNLHGQLGDGTTTDHFFPAQVPAFGGVVAVTAGQTHTVVRKADGTVWAWGANSFSGQLGDGTFIERSSPVQVTGVSAAKIVATGGQHSIVVLPTVTIAALAAMVQSMNLAPASSTALLASLSSAQRSLDAGNRSAACGQLGAFENKVRAFRGRSLTPADADRLITTTRRVRTNLGC